MQPDRMQPDPPKPWRGFLADLDDALETEVEMHCLGGFVVTVCYGLERPTADVDVLSVRPSGERERLIALAGEGSELHERHGVYLDVVTVVTYPDNYETRLTEVFGGSFDRLRLFVLDPYDLALAKLQRNISRDREDVKFLASKVPLDTDVLRRRYEEEMRSYLSTQEREDLTLDLWIKMIEEQRDEQHNDAESP